MGGIPIMGILIVGAVLYWGFHMNGFNNLKGIVMGSDNSQQQQQQPNNNNINVQKQSSNGNNKSVIRNVNNSSGSGNNNINQNKSQVQQYSNINGKVTTRTSSYNASKIRPRI